MHQQLWTDKAAYENTLIYGLETAAHCDSIIVRYTNTLACLLSYLDTH